MPDVHDRYSYPDGLTPGRSEDGGLSALLFNQQGNLADHASFSPGPDSSFDPMAEPDGGGAGPSSLVAAAVIGAAAMRAVAAGMYLAPRVAPWSRETLSAVSQRVRKVLGTAGDSWADDSEVHFEEMLAPRRAANAIAMGSKTIPPT